jgi:hypothetical protein
MERYQGYHGLFTKPIGSKFSIPRATNPPIKLNKRGRGLRKISRRARLDTLFYRLPRHWKRIERKYASDGTAFPQIHVKKQLIRKYIEHPPKLGVKNERFH